MTGALFCGLGFCDGGPVYSAIAGQHLPRTLDLDSLRREGWPVIRGGEQLDARYLELRCYEYPTGRLAILLPFDDLGTRAAVWNALNAHARWIRLRADFRLTEVTIFEKSL